MPSKKTKVKKPVHPGSKSFGPKNEHGLNFREEDFCQHYVREVNGRLAAKLAGYSEKTASEIAYEYLRKPHIIARIQAIRLGMDKKNDGLREKVLRKLMEMAELDVSALYDKRGKLKPVHQWDLTAKSSVQAIESNEDATGLNTVKKVKFSDRTKALDMLIKMQGYYAPDKLPVDDEGKVVPPTINITVVPPKEG